MKLAAMVLLLATGAPVAPVRDVRDVYFGETVTDPYRWMETGGPELAAWMKGQAAHTRAQLDALPLRKALLARIRELDNAGARVRSVTRYNDRVFTLESEPGSNTWRLFVRAGLGGNKRLLVDPDALATASTTFSIDYYSPSDDGGLVAYGLSPRGSEMSVLHVLDTATGKPLPDVIDRARYAGVSWLDGRSFLYSRQRKVAADAPEAERLTGGQVFVHVLGTDPERDVAVLGAGLSPDVTITRDQMPGAWVATGCPFVFGFTTPGVQPEVTMYMAPRDSMRAARIPWKRAITPADGITSVDVHGDDLYLLSILKAPRGKILKTSLSRPNVATAVPVVPEGKAIISSFTVARDGVYVRLLDAGVGRLVRLPFGGGTAVPIEIPSEGSVTDYFAEPTTDGALIRVDSWTEAPRLFVLRGGERAAAPTKVLPPSPVDFRGIVSREVKVPGPGGVEVPLSLIHRKDLVRDGKNLTHLEGYGAYGSVTDPFFQPMDLAWLERGGVQAICHPRGGGENGEDWHKAGMLARKTNTIDDFLACARWLVDEKYTSPGRLAGEGTSAGGIMIGGAVVRRPELFGAAIMRVGMLNALRFEQMPIGPFNTSEFGSVASKDGFAMLRAIDAYHSVKARTAYPAVLLTTGITDPRVSPWQVTKMAARLQAASSSGKPVLLRVDYGAGHGIGSTKAQVEEERADRFAFLLWQLGGLR
jgi:prolyl oligopeptidase